VTLYVDSSAYLKLFINEADSEDAQTVLNQDGDWVAARHTAIEVRRVLARYLGGSELDHARESFARAWSRTTIRELDERTCEAAALIAEETSVRTLDALHLASARLEAGTITVVTYDRRMAAAARRLGMVVLGA
jgi:predicted nucleic acid-binding protein